MALRWAAAGMLAAQGQFRRVKGYQELPQLAPRSSGRPPRSPTCSTCRPLSVPDRRIRHGGPPPKSNGERDILPVVTGTDGAL
jgi:hypothetical protein